MTSYEFPNSPYWTTPLDCGHVPTVPTYFHSTGIPLTTGAAIDLDGKAMCYQCAADKDIEAVAEGKEILAYVSGDGKHITTWAGIALMEVTYNGTARNGWNGSSISYISAAAPNGKRYYGKNGGNGMAIKLRSYKEKEVN